MYAAVDTPLGTIPDRKTFNRVRAQLATYNRSFSPTMTEVKHWPFNRDDVQGMSPPIRAWRSNKFIAALYEEPAKHALRLSVCRAVLGDDGRFLADISWDELQAVKRECGFGDREAVEIFPRDADVVNVSNMRHLWMLSEPCPLVWR